MHRLEIDFPVSRKFSFEFISRDNEKVNPFVNERKLNELVIMICTNVSFQTLGVLVTFSYTCMRETQFQKLEPRFRDFLSFESLLLKSNFDHLREN